MDDIYYLGVDIGGANLKIVGLNKNKQINFVSQEKCEIWRGLSDFNKKIIKVNKLISNKTVIGITMTAEMCDYFKNRKKGVKKIIKHIRKVFNNNVFFWESINNKSFSTDPSYKNVASMNWLATGKFISKKISNAVVIDLGSTTTDLVFIRKNQVINKGFTDFKRIIFSELIYTGFTRTPLFGITDKLKFNKKNYSILPENFSNISDVYRVLRKASSKIDLFDTMDGRSKSFLNSLRRIARNFGFDYKNKKKKLILNLCEEIEKIQFSKITDSIKKNLRRHKMSKKEMSLIICGIGKDYLYEKFVKKGFKVLKFEDIISGKSNLRTKAAFHAPATSCAFLISSVK